MSQCDVCWRSGVETVKEENCKKVVCEDCVGKCC